MRKTIQVKWKYIPEARTYALVIEGREGEEFTPPEETCGVLQTKEEVNQKVRHWMHGRAKEHIQWIGRITSVDKTSKMVLVMKAVFKMRC